MQLLIKKKREAVAIKNNEIVGDEQVGGIKIVYNIIKPGITLPLLRSRIGDRILGEYVFLKPLRKHLNEEKIDVKTKTKNIMCNTWLLLNANFNDIRTDIKTIRIKGIVKDHSLISALNRNVSEITIDDSYINYLQ